MACIHPFPSSRLQKLVHLSKATSIFQYSVQNRLSAPFPIMNFSSISEPSSVSSSTVYEVPGLDSNEMDSVAAKAFERYTSKTVKRNGKGVAIVWFRNDLRVLDNESLLKAWVSSEAVLPVYCIDPRLFETTHYFGFPKTGALRAEFLMECLADLKKNLMKRGLNLLIRHGKPEDILPVLAKAFGAHTVYAHKETCSEELHVERLVGKGLRGVVLSYPEKSTGPSSTNSSKLQLIWGSTMYHINDLPFSIKNLPDMYTQFRKFMEAKSSVRGCIKIPTSLGPPPCIDDWGCIPSFDQLGINSQKAQVSKGMRFVGGETAALSRVTEYFWKKDFIRIYKETRNGMLGPDYSTKFSPWLASGSLSPRYVYEEVKRYERERQANNSTYWVLFELIWRDYFRFLSMKYGNSLFHLGGPRKVELRWSQDQRLFESWRDGCTGYPLIDANMKELSTTGFMSNRGRQIVCSFLVRDMGIDWRMGAEWFETCLLDYDPCSNYGNWTYGAEEFHCKTIDVSSRLPMNLVLDRCGLGNTIGVGNDPREDRYFSISKQAQNYDPKGEYVAYWLPQLQELPEGERNFPGKSYMNPVVPLKFGNTNKQHSQETAGAARRTNFGLKHRGHKR